MPIEYIMIRFEFFAFIIPTGNVSEVRIQLNTKM